MILLEIGDDEVVEEMMVVVVVVVAPFSPREALELITVLLLRMLFAVM